MLKKSLFVVLLAIQITGLSVSAQDRSKILDSFFTAASNGQELNGNVLVAEKGTVLYKRSFGYADKEGKQLNSDSSVFQLASISKTFVAIAVLQLKEKGVIHLDDRFIKYFPDFPYPAVTLRQMLSHTSGLPDYSVFKEMVTQYPDRVCTNEDIIPQMRAQKMPLLFTPGDKWSYCNLNFDLLVLLVEKITKRRFEDYIKKNILVPAGMNHTYIKTPLINAAHLANEAYNYDYPFLFSERSVRVTESFSLPRFKIYYYNLSGLVGDGCFYSTTEDLYKYDKALYEGKLLKPSTLEEALTPARLNNGDPANADIGIGKASYGLGWFIFEDSSAGKIVWHTGGAAGCWTIFLRNVTKKQLVVLLENTEAPGTYKAGVSAMNLLNDKPVVSAKRSLVRPYGINLVSKGIDLAIGRLQEQRGDSANYYLSQREMNSLGYQLLSNGYEAQALEAFKLNTLLFPNSGNAFDSYGEALLKCEKKEEAILMYKRSILLDPGNKEGKKILDGLLNK